MPAASSDVPQKISVALCTYNGADYLPAQLQSLERQTVKPDELVVFDDASVDNSVEIVRRFSAGASFPVRILASQCNVASREAFAKCVEACRGDLIFLADQDDVWLPEKISRLAAALAAHSDAAFAFSDAALVDEHLQPLGGSMWDRIAFSPAQRRQFRAGRGFEVLFRRWFAVTGATMAFRAQYRPVLLPIPPAWVHDAWFAMLLSAISWGVPVEVPLIQYRQHPRQQIGAPPEQPRGFVARLRERLAGSEEPFDCVARRAADLAERLEMRAGPQAASVAARLRAKSRHYEFRARLPARRAQRCATVAGELFKGNYQRYSFGFRSAYRDLRFGV